MDAVDRHIPVPLRALDRPFLTPVESVLTMTGRGTVVTGKVEQGSIGPGQPGDVIGLGRITSVCTGLETYGRQLQSAVRQQCGASAPQSPPV